MPVYEYPPITGYRWNLIQKISITLGISETLIYTTDNVYTTCIGINLETITPTQKSQLDSIMAQPYPCNPPANTGNTTYRIVDIWSMRQWFIAQIGVTPKFWFEPEKPDGSGECYMYLQFPRALTTNEKNKITSTYRNMIGEVNM